jgi:hypothetical protein
MKRWAVGIVMACAAGIVGACMGAGVVQLSADTYRLSRADGGGRYPDAAAMKAAVVEDANAFASSRGKIAVEVATREETMRTGHLSTIDYDFKLVAPGEPAPAAAAAVPAVPTAPSAPAVALPAERGPAAVPAAGTAATVVPAAVVPSAGSEGKPDLYTELIKLDELRRRGILTDEEFQALKAKLIAGR